MALDLKAKRTPNDPATPGWFGILPERKPSAPLDKDIDSDWLIIGGGFAGLSAVYRLSQLSDETITVIDAQSIAWGAAGRNSGFMIDLPHDVQSEDYTGGVDKDKIKIRMNREAIEFAASAAQEFGFEAHFNCVGKYHGAANESGVANLGKFGQQLNALSEDYTVLKQSEMKSVTGTNYYIGGLFTPGCVLVQPAAYIRGLADGLDDRIRLYENTPAVHVKTGEHHLVNTPKGSIRCNKLLLANNGHLESFGLYQKRLVHIHLFASMTRKLTQQEQSLLGGQEYWGVIPALPMGSTVRRHGDRIVVRNHISYTPSQCASTKANKRSKQRHMRSFKARFPMLNEVQMEYHWAGALCLSLNSVTAFGEIEKGVYVAGCHNGLGLSEGTLAGKLIAEHAYGISSDSLTTLLNQDKPKRIVPEPFMSVGAKAHMWWGQRRVGLDL